MAKPLPSSTIIPLQLVEWLDELMAGFAMTLYLYVVALVCGFALGLVLALIRQYGGNVSSRIATGYIEIIRGTPLLAQLFIIYVFPYSINAWFDSPVFDIRWQIELGGIVLLNHGIASSFIALSLNSAAYQAEYLRGAMISIGEGQLLAAESIGFSRFESLRYIIIPQALRRAIPSWSNEAVYLPKYTVVATFIAVEDILGKAKLVVSRTFLALQTYLLVGGIFLVFISIVSQILNWVHQKTRIPGL